uniref:Uncharacterized protein n=1 Tax=Amphilophus citrinellus TaxID=61819 RepID=A0A3Q0RN50_AMPCI
VHGHQECRDREELVVADAIAAGLLGVAGKARLFISPNALCSNHQDQDAEDKDDRQPNASNASISAYPGAKEGICVDTKGLSLPHYLLCLAGQRREGSF